VKNVPILETQNLGINFGKLQAVGEFALEVASGQIHGLIGPNGAGKTTVFNLVTGFYRPTTGRIFLDGEQISGLPPHVVAQKGLSRSFQQTLVFSRESVLENVVTSCHMRNRSAVVGEVFHSRRARKANEVNKEESLEILRLMGLEHVKDELAGNLPHGYQRALGVSMALASRPKVLLLDEPVTGMNPIETKEMSDRILAIREHGITIVLVEHSMQVVMSICDRITVMSYGRKIAEGTSDEVRNDSRVIEAYLGTEEHENAAGN
jgi:branched-chain amino acid transport system ATP-binding protein